MISARAPALSLVLSDNELTALIESAGGGAPPDPSVFGPDAAEWVVDGAIVGILADGLAALADPVCTIELRRGERLAAGGLDEQCATLIIPLARAGSHRLVVVTTPFLPDVLCRLNDVSPRPRPAATVLRYGASDLAQILATRDAALAAELADDEAAAAVATQLISSIREHWRVELVWAATGDSPGRRAVEVLDSDHGLWRILPDGDAVQLVPVTPSAVFRSFVGLLPDHSELAQPAA